MKVNKKRIEMDILGPETSRQRQRGASMQGKMGCVNLQVIESASNGFWQ